MPNILFCSKALPVPKVLADIVLLVQVRPVYETRSVLR